MTSGYYFQADAVTAPTTIVAPFQKKPSFPVTVYISSYVTSGFLFGRTNLSPPHMHSLESGNPEVRFAKWVELPQPVVHALRHLKVRDLRLQMVKLSPRKKLSALLDEE